MRGLQEIMEGRLVIMRRLVMVQVIMRRLATMILVGMDNMDGMAIMAIMDILVGIMATKVRAKEKAKAILQRDHNHRLLQDEALHLLGKRTNLHAEIG